MPTSHTVIFENSCLFGKWKWFWLLDYVCLLLINVNTLVKNHFVCDLLFFFYSPKFILYSLKLYDKVCGWGCWVLRKNKENSVVGHIIECIEIATTKNWDGRVSRRRICEDGTNKSWFEKRKTMESIIYCLWVCEVY